MSKGGDASPIGGQRVGLRNAVCKRVQEAGGDSGGGEDEPVQAPRVAKGQCRMHVVQRLGLEEEVHSLVARGGGQGVSLGLKGKSDSTVTPHLGVHHGPRTKTTNTSSIEPAPHLAMWH